MFYQVVYVNRLPDETSNIISSSGSWKDSSQSLIIYFKCCDKTNLNFVVYFLISSYRLNPSISGITMSIINRSYKPALKLFNANRASLTVSTCSNPFSIKAFLKVIVVSRSSSTIRILLLTLKLVAIYLLRLSLV